jgi:hypothetical protein
MVELGQACFVLVLNLREDDPMGSFCKCHGSTCGDVEADALQRSPNLIVLSDNFCKGRNLRQMLMSFADCTMQPFSVVSLTLLPISSTQMFPHRLNL